MLFDSDNENGVIVNGRDLYVSLSGSDKEWYLVGSAKAIPKSAKIIGRCGLYHFYLDEEGKGYCINGWRDM